MLAWLLVPLVAGSCVYGLLVAFAAWRYRAARPPATLDFPPITVLKPLAGADEGLEENLRSFFIQDYPDFEILFAVRDSTDPAVHVCESLRAAHPHISSRLVIAGEPPYPNAKVWSLASMAAEARHDLWVMSDSDVRVTPDCLRTLAAEFRNPGLALTTCPYRAAPGNSLWSALEAAGMNTEFLGGILVARLLEGMRFAVGPTIVARRVTIDAIGGFDRLRDYLAEDFAMGKFAAEAGLGVGLSSYIIEHRIGSQSFAVNMAHRLRWARSTRRSRPSGYAGQVFTNPLPLALALLVTAPGWWLLVLIALVVRAVAAWATAGFVLRDPLCARRWWLVPAQDMLSFVLWIAGFFGNTIHWRGRRYRLDPGGRFHDV
ncbi:MAG: bacteriohopanetetrol glucosamine biosynthesis glycosyltransferase HpnI [Bryobacteraceae bacterium]